MKTETVAIKSFALAALVNNTLVNNTLQSQFSRPILRMLLLGLAVSVSSLIHCVQSILSMTCEDDSSYVTSLDDPWFNARNSDSGEIKFLRGFGGVFTSSIDDRQFKFGSCYPTDSTGIEYDNFNYVSWTSWDAAWTIECDDGTAIYSIGSVHENSMEDRIYTFGCAGLVDKSLVNCAWANDGNYINSYRETFYYSCSDSGVIAGIKSVHSNSYEDRLWDFKCCQFS